jgi:hypothetical protein
MFGHIFCVYPNSSINHHIFHYISHIFPINPPYFPYLFQRSARHASALASSIATAGGNAGAAEAPSSTPQAFKNGGGREERDQKLGENHGKMAGKGLKCYESGKRIGKWLEEI